MANELIARTRFCALVLLCAGCGSERASEVSAARAGSAAGSAANDSAAGGSTAGAPPQGTLDSAGGAGKSNAGESGAAPPAVDGRSIYVLECHGDSKDCNLGAVPCFGVSSQTANIAAGWACANRCASTADCSNAPSGSEAQASCVSFTSANHCLLVCQNENQSFSCPGGMTCYVPAKSPIGYCLWQ